MFLNILDIFSLNVLKKVLNIIILNWCTRFLRSENLLVLIKKRVYFFSQAHANVTEA